MCCMSFVLTYYIFHVGESTIERNSTHETLNSSLRVPTFTSIVRVGLHTFVVILIIYIVSNAAQWNSFLLNVVFYEYLVIYLYIHIFMNNYVYMKYKILLTWETNKFGILQWNLHYLRRKKCFEKTTVKGLVFVVHNELGQT